jgi:hypothetical protein
MLEDRSSTFSARIFCAMICYLHRIEQIPRTQERRTRKKEIVCHSNSLPLSTLPTVPLRICTSALPDYKAPIHIYMHTYNPEPMNSRLTLALTFTLPNTYKCVYKCKCKCKYKCKWLAQTDMPGIPLFGIVCVVSVEVHPPRRHQNALSVLPRFAT